MELRSGDGAHLRLTPVRYQYPSIVPVGDGDWDANWLVVRGEVRLADGRSWTFTDPCLTTWEAAELGQVLRGDGGRRLQPLEPLLEPEVLERSIDRLELRVALGAEAAPAWREVHVGVEQLRLTVSATDVADALTDWATEIARFPPR